MGIDLKEYVKYMNKDKTMGILFLKGEKLDLNNFCGEKFKKLDTIDYVDHSGEMVLENPHKEGSSYAKELIESAHEVVKNMGFGNSRVFLPSSDSPLVICYNSEGKEGIPEHVMICAPRINNY